jgi:hypothetical protein
LIYQGFLDDIGGMNPKAVPQADVKARFGLVSVGLLAIVGLMSLALASTAAAAAPIGKGGKISACYRVKGKAKGAMRVVPAKKSCRHGERKLAWSVAGPPGSSGSNGAPGGQGQSGANGAQGQPGSDGASGTGEAGLETKIANLTVKISSLEGVLDGVSNTDLTETIDDLPLVKTSLAGLLPKVEGLEDELDPIASSLPSLESNVSSLTTDVKGVEDVLKGVTNTGLTEAVKAVPQVGALCSQAQTLTTQSNLLGTAVGGLSLNGALTILGGLLNIPALPASLPAFTCPA